MQNHRPKSQASLARRIAGATAGMIAAAGLFAGLSAATSRTADAAPITQLIFKLTDSGQTGLDAYTGWSGAGTFNENVAGAQLLTNNGLDYKSSLVDLWPANMQSVRVAFYSGGVEQAFIEFDPTGTTKNNFFANANVTSSTWTDVTSVPHVFFSIPGDDQYGRNWFIETQYGGCGNDTGHMVVLEQGTLPCGWEASRAGLIGDSTRAFLYADASTHQNWTFGAVGVADTFAVFATFEVPEPGSVALFGLAAAGIGLACRRRNG
jgi:hypothetical protein